MGVRKLTPDDDVRVAGRRRLLRRPDEVDVASNGKWVLAEVTGWGREGWKSFKVIHMVRARKNVYYIGFDGKRVARNRCGATLAQHNPDIYAWLIKELNERFADDSSSIK